MKVNLENARSWIEIQSQSMDIKLSEEQILQLSKEAIQIYQRQLSLTKDFEEALEVTMLVTIDKLQKI